MLTAIETHIESWLDIVAASNTFQIYFLVLHRQHRNKHTAVFEYQVT
jgi:hypothetical protein